jgi:hypothetical protein
MRPHLGAAKGGRHAGRARARLEQEQRPSGPTSAFAAIGHGGNTIWIDHEHDIVFVWHWYNTKSMDGMVRRWMFTGS